MDMQLSVMVLGLLSSCRGGLLDESWGYNCSHVIPHGRVEMGCSISCSYYCDAGYEKGVLHITYLECSTANEWHWRSTNWHQLKDLLCQPKHCQTTIPNGQLLSACAATVGSTCEYSCSVGYLKKFWTPNITCEPSTQWSRNPHQLCTTDQQCPYEIANGELEVSCRRLPGITCKYGCREGYMPLDSPGTIICGSNSNWDKSLSSLCTKIMCPLAILNGKIASVCSRDYNRKCYSYECSAGHEKPLQTVTLTCNQSGLWDWDRERSESPCLNTEDLCPKTIPNGKINRFCDRKHGSKCDFTCDMGCSKYKAYDQSRLLLCKDNSEWNEPPLGVCRHCDQTTTLTPAACPASILNGGIDPSCKIRFRHECYYACFNACYPAFEQLYCTSLGYWENEANACKCGVTQSPEKRAETEEWSVKSKAAIIGGAVAGAIGVVIAIAIVCFLCCIRGRCKQRTESGTVISYHGVSYRTHPRGELLQPHQTFLIFNPLK